MMGLQEKGERNESNTGSLLCFYEVHKATRSCPHSHFFISSCIWFQINFSQRRNWKPQVSGIPSGTSRQWGFCLGKSKKGSVHLRLLNNFKSSSKRCIVKPGQSTPPQGISSKYDQEIPESEPSAQDFKNIFFLLLPIWKKESPFLQDPGSFGPLF